MSHLVGSFAALVPLVPAIYDMATDPSPSHLIALMANVLVALLQVLPIIRSRKEPVMSAATITPSRLLLKVEEVAEILNVGRSTAYHLVLTGEIESITVGRLRRVPAQAVSEYVDRLRADLDKVRGDGVA